MSQLRSLKLDKISLTENGPYLKCLTTYCLKSDLKKVSRHIKAR
jgi:hypothetical protein